MVAQELAVTHPERVERLALVCTSPGGTSPSYPLHELAGMGEAERAALRTVACSTRASRRSGSPTHPSDQRLVEMMAGRSAPVDRRAGSVARPSS